MIIGKTIEEIRIGETAEFSKTISECDIYTYTGVTGDFNPIHIDEDYSQKTAFKTRIAQGMLIGGFISTVLGTQLPGPGAIYVSQELKFLAPVYINDTITACLEVVAIDKGNNRVTLRTSVFNQDGLRVLDGQAVMSPPKKAIVKVPKVELKAV